MPKSLLEVEDEFEVWKQQNAGHPAVTTATLQDYAKQADESSGTPGERAAGYDPRWYNRANALVDRGFRATHLPELTGAAAGAVGGGFDTLFGTHVGPTVRRLGEDLPRMATEAALTIPETLSVAGAPVAVATWANRLRQIHNIVRPALKTAGYAGTALSGYDQTGSPLGAAIAAGSMGASNKLLLPAERGGLDVMGRATGKLRDMLGIAAPEVDASLGKVIGAEYPDTHYSPDKLRNALAVGGGIGAEAGTQVGINELTRQAQLSVGDNAVGPFDSERNPFTQENVAGNIAGLAPFALHGALAFREGATGFDQRQAKPLIDWIKNQREAVETSAKTPSEITADVKDVVANPYSPKETHLLRESVRVNLDAARAAQEHGDIALADRHSMKAAQAIRMLGDPVQTSSSTLQSIRETQIQARSGLAMSSPDAFADFLHRVNTNIETWNNNKEEFLRILQDSPETLPVVRDETSLKAFQEAKKAQTLAETARAVSDPMNPKQAWAQNAVDPLLIVQLEREGHLKPITKEWLVEEGKVTEDALQTMDPRFFNDVLAQKMANYQLSQIPEALRKRAEMSFGSTVETETMTRRKAKLDAEYFELTKTIRGFPQEIQQRLAKETTYWAQQPVAPSKIDPQRLAHPMPTWREAVIKAGETYNPVDQKIDLGNGRGREPIAVLWSAPEGFQRFVPQPRVLSVLEGGTPTYQWTNPKTGKKKTYNEEYIEGLTPTKKEGTMSDDRFDEMVQSGEIDPTEVATKGVFSKESSVGEVKPTTYKTKEGEVRSVLGEQTDLGTTSEGRAFTNTLEKKGILLRTSLEKLTPETAYNLLKPVVSEPRLQPDLAAFHTAHAKEILAALVDLSSPKPGQKGDEITPAGETLLAVSPWKFQGTKATQVREVLDKVLRAGKNPRVLLEKARELVTRLTDEKAQKVAQGYKGPMMMSAPGGEGEKPLVRFSGPVRLRRWAAAPSGGYVPDSLGQIPSKSVKNLLQRLGVTKDEMSIYEAAGLDEKLKQWKVGAEGLAQWMEEKAPRVEVKKLEPAQFGALDQNYGELQHQLETLGYTVEGDKIWRKDGTRVLDSRDLPEADAKLVENYWNVSSEVDKGTSDAATGRYGVEPKDLKDMPGAVDILVRVPFDVNAAKLQDRNSPDAPMRSGVLYRGPHFGESDRNVLASVRGYVETLPTGEKVFHVFEVQSDWGQNRAKIQQQLKEHPNRGGRVGYLGNDHPLLAVYEQLALKAAVAHAREIGAKYVAVSDAETAMMTEGHDRYSAGPDKEGVIRIAQAPGMRAAYDVRLPNAMEKLTGGKGQLVDFGPNKNARDIRTENDAGPNFDAAGNVIEPTGTLRGSPVFKDVTGNPKTSVTARLYDISRAPDEFAAYGYSKPMALGETVATPEGDLIAPHPKKGAFNDDVLRTITAALDKHFGGKGYSGDMRAMYQAAALAIVRTMKDVPVDFYKVSDKSVAGLANENLVPGRAQLGLGVTPIDMETSSHFAHRVLVALTHELSHIDDFVHFGGLKTPDAYSEERARQLTNLRSMYDAMDVDQRTAVLTTLDEALTPPGYRTAFSENTAQKARSVSNVDEFSATVMTLVTQSLLFGKGKGLKDALSTLDHSPTEVQEYAQYQYRAIRDVLQSMEDTLADPGIRAQAAKSAIATGNPFVLSKAFTAVTAAAIEASRVRDGMKDVASAVDTIRNMSRGAGAYIPSDPTESTWYRRQAKNVEVFGKMAETGAREMQNATEARGEAQKLLDIVIDPKNKLSWWGDWLAPFVQTMDEMKSKGVDLADRAAFLLGDTESSMRRVHSDIMAPLLRHDKDGTIAYDHDQPFTKRMSPRVRAGFQQVSQWQTEHGGVPMFVEVKGELVPDTAARPVWEKMKSRYSPEDQQAIIAGSVAWDKIGQNEARTILSTIVDSTKYRIASLFMGKDRSMTHDVAEAKAGQAVDAYLSNQVSSLDRTIPPAWRPFLDTIMLGDEGVVNQTFKLKTLFDSRPGHRTTSLPYDWVVMYKNAEDEVKYISAPTEKQARFQQARIEEQGGHRIGEIVNKREMRGKYADFDDPDSVLYKFAEVEGRLWQKVVEQTRTTEGNEAADALAASFTPGAGSLQDITNQTFKKYFAPKKGQIELENHDFLDAGLARTARLAASVAFKLNGQAKDLLLADPRARMFPTFRDRVNKQWDHITSPTSKLVQQTRTMGSAYYLALNLSSMVYEGTQSITGFLPLIIAGNEKGGIVKGVADLGRAIATAARTTDSEFLRMGKAAYDKAEAAVRRGEEPVLTRDEMLAGQYYRATNNGDIGHGVIQDQGYSRGQKAQEIARFGQGDYGPTPMATFVTDKLYNAAQFGLQYYGGVSKFNDKIAFFAGLAQALDKKEPAGWNNLYYQAKNFKNLTTFGGGKANAIGAVQAKDPHIRSALALSTTLQSYAFGTVANYIKLARDSFDGNTELTPQQRRQAFKGLMSMFALQTSVAGVLGLPFTGAAMALIEKATGTPVQQLTREAIASLTQDEDQTSGWTEGIMNGLGNQLTGLDVSSRLGVSNLLGTSSYRGFSWADMAGPLPTIAENMVKSLGYFGQNEPLRGAKELVPQAFKTIFGMADSHRKYNDLAIRDGGENLLYTPTAQQNIARGFGFRSREESQRRQAESMVSAAEKRTSQTTDRAADDAARRLLSGDPQGARLYAQDTAQQVPGTDARDVLRGVMERAVRMTTEKDLLASGSRAGAEERRRIVGTFGDGVNERQSEVGLTRLRTQLAAQLGAPELMPQGEAWQKAVMVDAMVRDRGATRSQALAMVQMLMGGGGTPSSLGPRSSAFGGP